MRRLILIRHGESQLNAAYKTEKIFCGQFETPLTELGREQARLAGTELAKRDDLRIAHAVSSNLGRARETLDLIVRHLPHLPRVATPVPAFNERSLGIFEGRPEAEVFREFPQYLADPLSRFREDFLHKAPQGENLSEVTARAWSALETLLTTTEGDLLIVSHFATIRCLLARALQLPEPELLQLRPKHATPFVLQVDAGFRLEEEPTERGSAGSRSTSR